MSTLRTCVIPAGGFGTRFLPASKVIPKEMLPLVDKPIIQYGVEEALASGLDRVVVVTSRGKDSILDHFDRSVELERSLEGRGKDDLLGEVRATASLANIVAVRQKSIRGLGDAVNAAHPAVGDEPFAVLLPDDVIIGETPCLAQMRRIWDETKRPVIALMEVTPEETKRYGVVAGRDLGDGRFLIQDMIEKPQSDPPSNYAIIGRYILTPDIFEALDAGRPGAGGEIQITDAIRTLIANGDVYGVLFDGTRYDAGEKLGWLQATVACALRDPRFGAEFREILRQMLAE